MGGNKVGICCDSWSRLVEPVIHFSSVRRSSTSTLKSRVSPTVTVDTVLYCYCFNSRIAQDQEVIDGLSTVFIDKERAPILTEQSVDASPPIRD